MKIRQTLLISTLMVALLACASKPKPIQEQVVQTAAETIPAPLPAPTQAPAPVFQAPVDVAPVVTIDPNAPTPGSAADFAYQSGGEPRVFFGYNQYDLNAETRNALKRQADWLNLYNNVSATIEGNADERGTREYNLALAARRAESIKSYLVGLGIGPSRLTTVSYGKERPIDARSSEAGWARNRNGHTNVTRGTVG